MSEQRLASDQHAHARRVALLAWMRDQPRVALTTREIRNDSGLYDGRSHGITNYDLDALRRHGLIRHPSHGFWRVADVR
jgi:hypothetical protein